MQNNNILKPPIDDRRNWLNLNGASIGLALTQAIAQQKQPLIIIAPDSLFVARLIEELHFFNDNQPANYLLFPDWETLPYDHFSPHQDIISERLATLNRLPYIKDGALITTVATLMHRLPPPSYLAAHHFNLAVGDALNIDILRTRLTQAGYHAVSQVREHGEYAIRGSIIDLFPMGSDQPFRIDLFDDEIESIRLFSTETQRSLEKIDKIILLPAKEFPLTEAAIELFRQNWRGQFGGNPLKCPTYQDISEGIAAPGIEYYLPLFYTSTHTLFDYLPRDALIVTIGDVLLKAQEFWQEISSRYEQGRHDSMHPLLPPAKLFISPPELKDNLVNPHIQISPPDVTAGKSTDFATLPAPTLSINREASQPLAAIKEYVEKESGRILFCAETLGRREVILQLFKTIHLTPSFFSTWSEFLTSDANLGITVAPLDEGFKLTHPSLTLLTENQLYGKRVMQRRLRKKAAIDPDAIIRDFTELQIGDPIVHIDHGVGRYLGLETLTVGNQAGEFLALEYQGGDKLYVPVANLHLIARYTGANVENTPINKLGTDHWQKAKRRAAEKIRDVAAELLELYAKRAARPGVAFSLPEQYAVFANSFPFEETQDQLQAIEQVFADMMSDKPMDRVICGDVGFGKTEVALRAAFLAVLNNKQVAMLVPTTLLAQQHFQNFQTRFANWPINVEMVSRFRTSKEQKNILENAKMGKVDILIGTHKLLQSDICFKSLGLVIIDEEHLFGVKQKEKLKALRASVDILTLTATPIPRTLNMALAGIRDLSVIATPPARRLSVKTFVNEYKNPIIQEAILRELLRGGQVYFLHNDVSTIDKKAEEIKKLVPEARTSVAHGQMHERELERVMSEFYHRHSNVLICSTIIESGIDIPTANTIIINRADKFGLAQLHQLRGRVGRSHHQAYAYLLTPAADQITADAVKRLEAIQMYTDLGIGFTLATHDLEIRGAGELLGEEQSGDMQEIGFTLYMDLLSRAVDALKAGKEPELENSLLEHHTEVDLRIPALIPDNYLNDVQLRLQFYKRMANAKDQMELDSIQVEMIDRFGLLPQPLKNLVGVSEIKQLADRLGIRKLEANNLGGKLEFIDKPAVTPETILYLIQNKPQEFKLDGPTKLRFTLPQHDPQTRISLVKDVLQNLLT